MTKKQIVDSLDKLSKGELKALWQHIQHQYVPDFGEKEDEMLRDDIRDKVFDMINADFVEPRFIAQEQYNWIELNMDANDVNVLAIFLEKEFDIDFINPDDINKWQTVSDIVDYIEDVLECALHDMGN